MRTSITFEIDSDQLPLWTDEYLAQLWHIAQANPAAFGDANACRIAEHIGREIIRRWLGMTPPALWNHQGSHIDSPVAKKEEAIPTPADLAARIKKWFDERTDPATVDEVIVNALNQEPAPWIRTVVEAELQHPAYSKISWQPPYQMTTVKAYIRQPGCDNTPIYLDGPQGCGKTRNAEALADALGCTAIVDDGEVADPGQKPLVIGKLPPMLPRGAVAIQVSDSKGLDTLITSLRPSAS